VNKLRTMNYDKLAYLKWVGHSEEVSDDHYGMPGDGEWERAIAPKNDIENGNDNAGRNETN
jgi:hypothetical protein